MVGTVSVDHTSRYCTSPNMAGKNVPPSLKMVMELEYHRMFKLFVDKYDQISELMMLLQSGVSNLVFKISDYCSDS
jgi:hypothetical protein